MTARHVRIGLGWAALALLPLAGTPARGDDPKAKKDTKSFVNSKDGLKGSRADHYVDFTFDHPAGWRVTREEGDKNPNYITVERRGGKDEDSTLEQFNVGSYYQKASGNEALLDLKGDELKKAAREKLVAGLKRELEPGFPGAKLTREGVCKVAGLDGYEVRYAGEIDNKEEKITAKYWVRVVMVPNPDGGENGITLFMVGTSLAPELKEEKDLCEEGQMPVILKSFKLWRSKKE